MVIDKSGIPLFLFPDVEEFNGVKIDSVLFSGLITALNTLSVEATGDIVGEAMFGPLLATMSLDNEKNIHVFITSREIPVELNKGLHIEFKGLFLSLIRKHNIELSPEKILDGGKELAKKFKPELDPLYRLWKKTYSSNK